MVQFSNKEACGHCSREHSSKDCPENLPNQCTLCKGNHKAWERVCLLKKQELDRIAQALLLTSHQYPAKTPAFQSPISAADKKVFYKTDMDITPFLPPQQSQPPRNRDASRPAKFLATNSLLFPKRTSQKTHAIKIQVSSKNFLDQLDLPPKKLFISER